MTQSLTNEEFGKLLAAIDNEQTGKLSELAKIAGLSLAKDYIGADLSREDLSDDDLSGANLSNANLSNSNFRNTNLRNANLNGANLNGANLNGANLNGANLNGANLDGANLNGANLNGVDLDHTHIEKARFGFNSEIPNEIKHDLIRRGAIFEDSPSDLKKAKPMSDNPHFRKNISFSMEPVTDIASTIISLIFRAAIEEAAEALGKSAAEKAFQMITAIYKKFETAGAEELLTRAQKQPTEYNLSIVERELVKQMHQDAVFNRELAELLNSAGQISSHRQISGDVQMGASFKDVQFTGSDSTRLNVGKNTKND